MVTQELIDNITRRLSQGQRRQDIKDALMATGWDDIDVDEAFSTIQSEALKQIPLVAWWTTFMGNLDKKTANLPVRITIAILGGAALVLVLIAYGLYLFLDPFNAQGAARDQVRATMLKQIHTGIDSYYATNGMYPVKLKDLVPKYLQTVPVDPKSQKSFAYQVSGNRTTYQLCMVFETDSEQCIGSENADLPISTVPSSVPESVVPSGSSSDSSKTYTISGIVFADANKNAKKDTGEEGAAKRIVTVMDLSTKKNVCDVQSDDQGNFVCTLPGKGFYEVAVTVPSTVTVTTLNPQPVSLPDPEHPNETDAFVVFGLAENAGTGVSVVPSPQK